MFDKVTGKKKSEIDKGLLGKFRDKIKVDKITGKVK